MTAFKNFNSNIENIIAIASGKGGVGKSTITINLAISLVKQGYKVGLLDADIFGPSIPKMFGVEKEQPVIKKIGKKEFIIPIEKFGVKFISIGFFVDGDNALVWRGPMAGNALQQLINNTSWGELDFLLIDLPPGTSDIHLTLVQTVAVSASIIVSTPQSLALADAKKAISMFRQDKINVPILGIVENMAYFTPKELPNNKYYIFGKSGAKELSKKENIELLAEIPIVQSLREAGDNGKAEEPFKNSILSEKFKILTKNTITSLEKRKKKSETKKVEITNMDGCKN